MHSFILYLYVILEKSAADYAKDGAKVVGSALGTIATFAASKLSETLNKDKSNKDSNNASSSNSAAKTAYGSSGNIGYLKSKPKADLPIESSNNTSYNSNSLNNKYTKKKTTSLRLEHRSKDTDEVDDIFETNKKKSDNENMDDFFEDLPTQNMNNNNEDVDDLLSFETSKKKKAAKKKKQKS